VKSLASSSTGIQTEAISYFVELESNNNREWWTQNKDRYQRTVRQPFETMLNDLGPTFGPWRIYRPHRDTRFAHNKEPYKNFIGAVAQQSSGNGVFIQISSKGLLIGSGYPMMATDQLTTFRAAIADDITGADFIDRLRDVNAVGLPVTGGRYEPLKRNPKGYPAGHPREEVLRWKGVEIPQRLGTPRWLATAQAPRKILEALNKGKPVTDWLDTHVGPSSLTPEEIWGR
jgi:uncharacterized protein (TIGR02453 family)